MANTDGVEYPPGEWTVDDLRTALQDNRTTHPLPTYDDEAVWKDFRTDTDLEPAVECVLEEADRAREQPLPRMTARMFDKSANQGKKSRRYYEALRRFRREPSVLALAACLERDRDYVDAVEDYAWALCEQTTWLNPRHTSGDGQIDGVPRPRHALDPSDRYLTHYSGWIAHQLGEIDYVLGDHLHAGVRERIRYEVDERVLRPYKIRAFSWQTKSNNWNAVCNSRIALAALYLEDDIDRLAEIVHTAVQSLEHYLEGFGADGATAEGVNYWDYGMRYYVQFAAHLEERTGGSHSLLSPPIVREIAQFPLRVRLSPGRYPPFSDSLERYAPRPATFFWLGDRLDLPQVSALGWETLRDDGLDLHNFRPVDLPSLAWSQLNEREQVSPPLRSFLSDDEWWVSRTDTTDDALVVAAKGGHNGESHNHNDCGSFMVHYCGESLVTDLGAPSYSRDYGNDRRYEFLAARSLGHPVPYVNGHEQAAGRTFAARVIDRVESANRDEVTIELADAYPDGAGLDSLRRTVGLDREAKTVEVVDRASFEPDAPGRRLETSVLSFEPIERTRAGLTVTGERSRVSVEASVPVVTHEHIENAVNASYRDVHEEREPDVWRARVGDDFDGDEAAVIELTIRPEPLDVVE